MSEVLGGMFKYLLALIAIGAVVAIFWAATQNNKIGTEATNIAQLASAAGQLAEGSSNTSTITNANLITAQTAPPAMISGTSSLIDPWGNSVTVTGDTSNDIIITEPGLTAQQCVKLATTVNNYTNLVIAGATAITPTSATVATIVTDCKGGGSLVWTFNG